MQTCATVPRLPCCLPGFIKWFDCHAVHIFTLALRASCSYRGVHAIGIPRHQPSHLDRTERRHTLRSCCRDTIPPRCEDDHSACRPTRWSFPSSSSETLLCACRGTVARSENDLGINRNRYAPAEIHGQSGLENVADGRIEVGTTPLSHWFTWDGFTSVRSWFPIDS
jgi:hypothetical protein